MTPLEKALAWIPFGVQACLEDVGEALSDPHIAASKLLGELLLTSRAIGQPMRDALISMKPQLKVLLDIANSSTEEDYRFVKWQLKWLCGSSAEPPSTAKYLAWETNYFLEIAGAQSYSGAFWQQSAAQALYGVLTDDRHIRVHLYNFTHAVFYGSDFGRRKLFRLNHAATAILHAIPAMLAASHEWDLYYEVQAARAMIDMLPPSWLLEVERMDALPGQNLRGWVASSPEENALLSKYGAFEKNYATVHSTLAALLAVFLAQQALRSENAHHLTIKD